MTWPANRPRGPEQAGKWAPPRALPRLLLRVSVRWETCVSHTIVLGDGPFGMPYVVVQVGAGTLSQRTLSEAKPGAHRRRTRTVW